MNIGVIRIGEMGRPIAANLLKAGHSVVVYNRTLACAASLEASIAAPRTVPLVPSSATSSAAMIARFKPHGSSARVWRHLAHPGEPLIWKIDGK